VVDSKAGHASLWRPCWKSIACPMDIFAPPCFSMQVLVAAAKAARRVGKSLLEGRPDPPAGNHLSELDEVTVVARAVEKAMKELDTAIMDSMELLDRADDPTDPMVSFGGAIGQSQSADCCFAQCRVALHGPCMPTHNGSLFLCCITLTREAMERGHAIRLRHAMPTALGIQIQGSQQVSSFPRCWRLIG
jgi:hypothetical protein